MNLKNYTSTVPASTSITRICRALVEAGATDISQKYDPDTKTCIAISFRVVITGHIPMFFQLPAKVDPCFNVLWKEVKRPHSDTKKKTMEQAERTAWKIVSDWVDIQLAMLQLQQADLLEVFLPYVYDPAKEKTFYQGLKELNFKGLLT